MADKLTPNSKTYKGSFRIHFKYGVVIGAVPTHPALGISEGKIFILEGCAERHPDAWKFCVGEAAFRNFVRKVLERGFGIFRGTDGSARPAYSAIRQFMMGIGGNFVGTTPIPHR